MIKWLYMNGFGVLFLLVASLVFPACVFPDKSKEIANSLYLDYKIWGDEYNEEVTILLQFRQGGQYGETVLLKSPAAVSFDGQPLYPDSSRMTGPFYELQVPVSRFKGSHTILYRDTNGDEYLEKFDFQPIYLQKELPERLGRQELVLELTGLEKADIVRLLLTDTAFYSNGISRLDTVMDGKILISKSDLAKLVSGPVHLELIREIERPVKVRPEAGGLLLVSYGLSREFILTDSLLP